MNASAGCLLLVGLLCCALLDAGTLLGSPAQAGDGDRVDGAIWSFQLTPKNIRAENRQGFFRVNGKSLYQKGSREGGWDKVVGKKVAGARKKTILVFEDLRTNAGRNPPMQGRAEVEFNSFGEWTGRFVDSEGKHWDLKCSRIQE